MGSLIRSEDNLADQPCHRQKDALFFFPWDVIFLRTFLSYVPDERDFLILWHWLVFLSTFILSYFPFKRKTYWWRPENEIRAINTRLCSECSKSNLYSLQRGEKVVAIREVSLSKLRRSVMTCTLCACCEIKERSLLICSLLSFVCIAAPWKKTPFPCFTSWGYVRIALMPHTPTFWIPLYLSRKPLKIICSTLLALEGWPGWFI